MLEDRQEQEKTVKTTIREYTPDDYEAIAAVWTSAYPGYPVTAEEVRVGDTHRDPKCALMRYICEVDEGDGPKAVGVAMYENDAYMFHPRKYAIDIGVLAEYQGRGYGRALYDHMMTELMKRDPLVLRTWAREGVERSLRFVDDRGFVEDMREWESILDVPTFDFSKYTELEEKVRHKGIEITTLRKLMDDPDVKQKLYDLSSTVSADVPSQDEYTKPSFESFVKRTFESPSLLPDAYTIATDKGHYVGLSALWKGQADETIQTGLTAVRREYRRMGIATAMKLNGIRWCAENGHKAIRTENEVNNVGMLSINVELGYVRQPAWISFQKTVGEE